MIVGIGVDVCDLQRWEDALVRHPGLVQKVLTSAESSLPKLSQAARFAAKEALAKALGGPDGLRWHEVEVVVEQSGKPRLHLTGGSAGTVQERGVTDIHLSLSHDGALAVAFVICEAQ